MLWMGRGDEGKDGEEVRIKGRNREGWGSLWVRSLKMGKSE